MEPHTTETRQQRRARERRQLRTQKPRKSPSRIWLWCTKIPRGVYAAIGAAALLVGFFVLYPWLSLEQGERLRPTDPFGIVLNISDEGYFPLRDISVDCNADMITSSGGTLKNITGGFEHFSESLSFKHKLSLPCFRAFKVDVPLRMVDLRIYVSYNIWLIPGRRIQSFTLKGAADASGEWHWLFND